MKVRFYIEPKDWPLVGTSFSLPDAEMEHLRVLRLQVGSEVQILDGQGRIGLAHLLSLEKRKAIFTLDSLSEEPKPSSQVILALALSKATSRRSFLAEKVVELGASEIWLWQAEFSQAKLSDSMLKSWQNQAIAGLKQSANPFLPQIKMLKRGLAELIELSQNVNLRILPWELQDSGQMLLPEYLGRDGRTLYVIGPEGGFAKEELATFQAADFHFVSLGPRILRCETAATLCLALHSWQNALLKAEAMQVQSSD